MDIKDRIIKASNQGLIKLGDMWWTSEDIPAYKYLQDSHKGEMEKILRHLTGYKTVVQAGAHCGYVIKELLPHFDTIYTFEPDNIMFTALCLNIPNKNVFKFQACLGEKHKMVGMEDNLMCPYSGAKFVKGEGIIPMLTIDDLALSNCDLIMLDLEGNEYNALLGAERIVNTFHPLLCLERHWGPRTTGLPESVLESLLISWGYKEVAKTGENLQDHIYKYKG